MPERPDAHAPPPGQIAGEGDGCFVAPTPSPAPTKDLASNRPTENAPCPHEDFVANVDVNRLTKDEDGPVTAFSASIRVECLACHERFRFLGPMEVGDVANRPTVSLDHCELRAPIVPVSAPEDFGLDRHGFTMRADFDPTRSN